MPVAHGFRMAPIPSRHEGEGFFTPLKVLAAYGAINNQRTEA
jgi:hypothetical protein